MSGLGLKDNNDRNINALKNGLKKTEKRINRLENILLNIKFNSDLFLRIMHLERGIVDREIRMLKLEKEIEELKNEIKN